MLLGIFTLPIFAAMVGITVIVLEPFKAWVVWMGLIFPLVFFLPLYLEGEPPTHTEQALTVAVQPCRQLRVGKPASCSCAYA